MRLYILLLISVLSCTIGYSQSPNSDEGWIYVGATKGKEKYYIELEGSVKTVDNFGEKEMWVKCVQPSLQLKKNDKVITYANTITLTLHEINCSKKEMRVKQEIIYSSTGDILLSSGNMYPDFKKVVPGTIGETILKESCKLQ